MKHFATLTVLLLDWSLTFGEFPAQFKHCDREDRNFDKCLSDAISDAIKKLSAPLPEYGLPDLEPLTLKYFQLLPFSGAPWDLLSDLTEADFAFQGDFSNYEIHGITKTNFSTAAKLKFYDVDHLKIILTFPKLEHKFVCNLNGEFKERPVTGKGSGSATSTNTTFTFLFYLFPVVSGGKHYYGEISIDVSIKTKNVEYDFDNYKGVISAAEITQLINDNSIGFFGITMHSFSYYSFAYYILKKHLLDFFKKVYIEELW